MKWQVTTIAIAIAALGCDDLPDCPGADVCGRDDNIFTKNECGCSCTPDQEVDPQHMCCEDGPACAETSDDPDAGSGMTPATVPRVSVESLSALDGNDNFIDACEPFGVSFAYVNRMNGTLQSPSDYNLPIPMLVVSEVGLGTTPPPDPRPVPWESGLAAGGVDPHDEEYDDGIEPDNSDKSGTFAITISQLPVVASGVSTISKDIGLFGSECI